MFPTKVRGPWSMRLRGILPAAIAGMLLFALNTASRAQVPATPDFKSGGRKDVQGILTVKQHTESVRPDSKYTEDFTVRCAVLFKQLQGPLAPGPGSTAERAKSARGDIYSVGAAAPEVIAGGAVGGGSGRSVGAGVGGAAGAQGLASAHFQSFATKNDGASTRINVDTAKARIIGSMRVEAPGSDRLKPVFLIVALGQGDCVERDSKGKETKIVVPGAPISLDPALDLAFSKKELNAGYDSGKSFHVQAHDTVRRMEGNAQVTIDASINLQVGTVNEAYEMEIFPEDDYETWMPEGGKDEQTPGNLLRVRVLIRTADGQQPFYSPLKVTASLIDTSKEPGVCLNYPLVGGEAQGKRTPDYKLDQANGQDPPVTPTEDGQSLTFAGAACTDQHAYVFYVRSFDYGGWTTLKVVAEMPEGKKVTGYLTGKKTVTMIPIPFRNNPDKSHIANAFWKKFASPVQDDNWDKAHQDSNNNDGDGYSAYEKYRGVWAKGKHVQMTPTMKVLVVESHIGDEAEGAFAVFKKASGIDVVELAFGEMPDNHVINGNSGNGHNQDQCGLIVAYGNTHGGVGRTVNTSGRDDDIPKSPRYCEKVLIDKDSVKKANMGDADAAANLYGDIAHEIAHGCHVAHHGDDLHTTAPKDNKIVIINNSVAMCYAQNDTEITKFPLVITGDIGLPHGTASGDVDCIMCYNHVFGWVLHDMAGRPVYCNLGDRNRPGTIFCRGAAGTGWNAPDHKVTNADGATVVMPMFGNAAVGNCMSQFQVKDK